jgi:hypothetical protein
MHSLTLALDGGEWSASHPGRLCYPLDRRLGGPQSWSGCGGEEKNTQPLPGLEPPIIQPVAQRYTTELSRLSVHRNEKYILLRTKFLYMRKITKF